MAIDLKLDVENFGPHTNLQYQGRISSVKIGMFANNGVGKTFISRAFRLASPLNGSKTSNNILTTNQTEGKFIFELDNPNDSVKQTRNLEITLVKDSKPIINNDTGYLFHVFNSDYVTDNLELNNYNPPSDDIQGYILGEANIDVTKENLELEKLKKQQVIIHDKIKEAIEKAIKDLDTLKINKNTKEYKNITFERVIEGIIVEERESFDSLKDMHQKLKSMPDDTKDVPIIYYTIDSSVLNDIESPLCTAFDKSTLHQNFVDEIKSKQDFIEHGLNLHRSNKEYCPFCKQNLNENAIEIINQYNQYIQDSEAKAIKQIENTIKKLEKLKSDIQKYHNDFNEINTKFNKVKTYLPSQKNELKSLDDNEPILSKIEEIIEMFITKKDDIAFTDFDFKEQINDINHYLEQLKQDLKEHVEEINALNNTKNSIKNEKLQLNKRLCNARYLDILKEQKTNVQESESLDSEISDLDSDIKEKERKTKIDKKQKVIESLKYFLNFFFHEKYSFDEENFCIKFKDEILSDNATHVLSDGEKGIVAFCYYLATVHTIIEKKEDYKNLFFVIDDPISSMDFHFVYAVAQSIRKINKHLALESNDRFIILTHNLEFMNLLMRNKVVKEKYILKKSIISKWTKESMLPYENHLSDILKISKREEPPSHTTPNSIRHVLETICKFENRDKNIGDFMSENQKLENNGYIYSVMQDLSHGVLRSQPPVTDEDVIDACTVVIDFISDKYQGQIEGLT
ncbi:MULTISPECIES: AAA family ATPase [Methanobacterium]|uniref:Protein CR006 P-loop domain-containing protein n=1 Tax=Methanobacterium bryantii TaxID=2161 RepID=A0A2A2H8M7_METBR|nr:MULTISPECIES: AAA family ATPase [Methanobacterium]OEC84384.1 hypothetical protein A9507_02265 [Methanobacterium sp. A39]PAV05620.1 hypothetical protein ASJ80_08915 [Methanobacterium bryantii]